MKSLHEKFDAQNNEFLLQFGTKNATKVLERRKSLSTM